MAVNLGEKMWKVFTVVLGVIIMPLAGWVWNTNVALAQLQNDLGDAEEVIADLEKKLAGSDDNSRQIIGIEKDIEYMKNSLGRIESMVTRKNK